MSSQLVQPSVGEVVEHIPAGAHICHIFSDDKDRNDVFLKFLLSGLKIGDCAACFSQKANEREINSLLSKNGLSYGELLNSGAFTLSDSSEVYFRDNIFDPDRIIELLEDYCLESKELEFPGMWVIAEMTSEIREVSGGNRLLEYEHRLGLLLEQYPVISVCQYDTRNFDEATIFEVIKAHPYVVAKGAVIRNPLFRQFSQFV